MIYRPNNDEAAVALLIAKRRNALNRGGSNLPDGETATPEERLIQDYCAVLAEIAVSRMLNLCWTGCGRGSDGLLDVGDCVEVRSITQPHKCISARAKDPDAVPVVLVLVDKATRECKALGWNYYHEVKSQGRRIDRDEYWVLPKSALHPMAKLKPLLTQALDLK